MFPSVSENSFAANCMYIKKQLRDVLRNCLIFKFTHHGLILGPPDYKGFWRYSRPLLTCFW